MSRAPYRGTTYSETCWDRSASPMTAHDLAKNNKSFNPFKVC